MPAFRKLLPTEMSLYREHLLRLDRGDRYARFAGTVSDGIIEEYCRKLDWGRTIIVGCFILGELRGAVELCTDRLLWPNKAELAVSVETSLQERGVGSLLIRRALTIARNRSIRQVHMICMAGNLRMRALARRHGGRVEVDGGEATVLIELPHPNQFSFALEALEDGAGAVGAVLDRFGSGLPDRVAA